MIAHIHKFREKLARGQICLGAGISFVDPAVTEALCDSVDFVWIDLEHTPIGVESLQSHLIAARAGGAPALVRVPSSDPAWAKRVLDIGAEGVIVPQVRSAQEVQAFVSACRYPPLGSRGFGPRRPSNYGRQGGKAFLDQANRDVFVVVQIETAQAVRAVKEILAQRSVWFARSSRRTGTCRRAGGHSRNNYSVARGADAGGNRHGARCRSCGACRGTGSELGAVRGRRKLYGPLRRSTFQFDSQETGNDLVRCQPPIGTCCGPGCFWSGLMPYSYSYSYSYSATRYSCSIDAAAAACP
jgi:hypothetical protein